MMFLKSRHRITNVSIQEEVSPQEEEDFPDYDNLNSDEDESDEEIEYSDQQRGFQKVARNDSLAKFLNTKSHRSTLPNDCSVIPQRSDAEKYEMRQQIGTQLNRWDDVVFKISLYTTMDDTTLIFKFLFKIFCMT